MKWFICILGLTLSFSTFANIQTKTLQNGMQVIVKPDTRADAVVAEVWYRVGSSYEPQGITGVSHVLEHMMFKGTRHYGPGEYSRIIAENGGKENAFTARDYTAYYSQVSSDKLPLIMRLEADRMANLKLNQTEFKKELAVVKEERRLRTDDNPQAKTYERFLASAHIATSYRQPIIGWMNDLDNMTVRDLTSWYHRWYAPNNAILVVVGNVKPKLVFALANKIFGGIKPVSIKKPKPQKALSPLGERDIKVHVPGKVPWLVMGYNVPSLVTIKNKPQAYALEVLAGVLDGGKSARLETHLVRGSKIASGVSAGYDMFSRLSGLFIFTGTPSQDHTIEQLKTALLEQIDQIKNHPITQAELDRVKNQVIAEFVYADDSLYNQARLLGSLATVGLPPSVLTNFVSNIQKVTIQQVQDVAKLYLTNKALTTAELIPEENNKGDN